MLISLKNNVSMFQVKLSIFEMTLKSVFLHDHPPHIMYYLTLLCGQQPLEPEFS